MVEAVTDDGELIELEYGLEDLAKAVADHYLASVQIKAWGVRKALAAKSIDVFQSEKTMAYDGPMFMLVAKKVAAGKGGVLDLEKIRNTEMGREELRQLVAAAKGFDVAAIDPGLKGNVPSKWKPTNPLGELVAPFLELQVTRAGFITVEPATKLAQDHD